MLSHIVLATILLGSAKPPTDAAVVKVQRFYDRIRDFTANFEQIYSSPLLEKPQTSTGTIAFLRPGRLRWDYAAPSPRTFLLLQGTALMFDPEAKMLTKSAIGDSPLAASLSFLMGKGSLARDFDVFPLPKVSPGVERLRLVPKAKQFTELLLDIDEATGAVRESTVVGNDGSRNSLRLTSLSVNKGLKPQRFVLDVPKDTEVQDFTTQAR